MIAGGRRGAGGGSVAGIIASWWLRPWPCMVSFVVVFIPSARHRHRIFGSAPYFALPRGIRVGCHLPASCQHLPRTDPAILHRTNKARERTHRHLDIAAGPTTQNQNQLRRPTINAISYYRILLLTQRRKGRRQYAFDVLSR